MYYVYWIHKVEHDDPDFQGYIGITNDLVRRLKQHNKGKTKTHLKNAIDSYGWDTLVKEVYCVLNSKEEALAVEGCLRPAKGIDWNIIKGGVATPDNCGHKFNVGRVSSDESQCKLSSALMGNTNGVGAKHSAEANLEKSNRLSGEKSPSNKLSIHDIMEIDTLLKSGVMHKDIAKMFGVTRMTITNINTRRCKYYRKVLEDNGTIS
jgi:predicted GIY-YIG superfamily endonuclease